MIMKTQHFLLGCALAVSLSLRADDKHKDAHADEDAFWADVAKFAPSFDAATAAVPTGPNDYHTLGNWGPVISWPHIPVSAANLPDGRIVTFASNRRTTFPAGTEFTYAATYNPETGQIVENNHPSHDMFCAHLVMLEDGRVFITGGRNTVPFVSTFDANNDQWQMVDQFNNGRWYPTTTALGNGQVVSTSGTGARNNSERWTPGLGWENLSGIDWGSIANAPGFESHWWPYLFLAPNGKLVHVGPTEQMHWLDPSGFGTLVPANETVPNTHYPKHAAIVMYDEGKIIIAGGSDHNGVAAGHSRGSTPNAVIVDVNGSEPVVTATSAMTHPRRFSNAIMLPTGEVLVIGGNTSGRKFSDEGTVLAPEVWNPQTGQWRELADMSVPRNYHSVALLLPDGRVYAGGGGLSGNSADHQDAQIFTPPHLFNVDGTLTTRPEIFSAPNTMRHGRTYTLTATAGLRKFSAIKMMATTHGLSTDHRHLSIPFTETSPGAYDLAPHVNANVLTPGYWMLFGLNGDDVFSEAKIVRVSRDGRPILVNPGDQQNNQGDTVNLALSGSDPDGDTLTFSSSTLPLGLAINPATGLISGSPNLVGAYAVTVTLTDAYGVFTTATFNWQVLGAGHPPGNGLKGDYYDKMNFQTLLLTRTDPTVDFNWLEESPDPSVPVNLFSARWTGWIMPQFSATYTFFTVSDDGSRLWIDNQLVVDNWGEHGARERSGAFTLTAGVPKPIRIEFMEGAGYATVRASWMGAGLPKQIIPQVVLFTDEPTIGNAPPVLSVPGNQGAVVGSPVDVTVNASDPDGDFMTYGAAGLPPGLTIDSQTGVILGSPTTAGTYTVNLSVSDGNGGSDSGSFVWTISEALGLAPMSSAPKQIGAPVHYTAVVTGGVSPRFRWDFGDGTPPTAFINSETISHTYTAPGRYLVTLTATDDTDAVVVTSFNQAVHGTPTANRPSLSMTIAYEERNGNDRVWNVNPDNNTVSVFDAVTNTKLAETPVGNKPRGVAIAPDGDVWVIVKGDARIKVLNPDNFTISRTFNLPNASQPAGLAFDPTRNHAYVTLEASGKLLRLDPITGAPTGSVDIGPRPRHLSVTADGARILVSRFITPPVPGEATASPQTSGAGGEVLVVNANSLTVTKTIKLRHSDKPDASDSGRGLPNYLGPPAISPDGKMAWVPSKQDNIKRGVGRDGQPLNHDMSLRAIASKIDLIGELEDYHARIDFDNHGIPSTALFGRFGSYLFVAGEASQEVIIVDPYGNREIDRFAVERAAQGLAISPDGLRLYVHNFLSRSISVIDLTQVVLEGKRDPAIIATWQTVANETLSAQVLLGKQHFYDARDTRLALEQYISCASCHNDGDHDGRVWDLTGFGEGLRNTISLVGHGGPAHGRLHWSANFDEVHDFEGQIRGLSGGRGLMSDTQFNAGTRDQPLGDPKAGLSADLDALAAYVNSLTSFDASPERSGPTLTTDAVAGKALFDSLNCAACHGGDAFTDSATGVLHNVGTLKPTSGNRLGGSLIGLDTPTLRGVWNTAPYLHDGSAATLAEAINAHNGVNLSGLQLDQLVAYVRQIDGLEPGLAPNEPPVLTAVPNQSTEQGTAVSVHLLASDPNNDPLTYSASGLPAGVSINSLSGQITGAPTVVGSGTVSVSVADGRGGSDTALFTWDVTAAPGGPTVIFDHGFETGQAVWGSDGASQIINDPAQARDGSHFLRIPAAGSTVVRYFEVPNANWQPGGEYSMEFFGRRSANASFVEAGFTFFDQNYNELPNAASSAVVTSTTWTKYTVGPVTAPANAVYLEFWALTAPDSGHGDFDVFRWIDNDAPGAPTAPTVTLTTPASTVSGPFPVSVNFSEAVSGLSGLDFTIGNGESLSLNGSAAQYSLQVDPLGTPVTVMLPANQVQNAAGQGNQASSTLTVQYSPPTTGAIYQHGFENGQPAWGADGNAQIVTGPAAEGQRLLRITDNNSATSVGYFEVPTSAWSVGQTYTLEFKGRLSNGATGAAEAGLTFFDQNYSEIANTVVSRSVAGNQWQTYQTDPVLVPANARHAELWALKGAGAGQGEFDDFQIKGAQAPPPPPPSSSNLVKNGGFEDLKAHWNESGLGAQTTAIIAGNQHAGAHALEIPAAGGGMSQPIPIDDSKTYRLRAWAYIDSGAGWMGFGATFQDAAGNQLPAPIAEHQITAPTWQEHTLTLNPPNGTVEILLWIWKVNGQGKGYIDELKLEQLP